MSFRPRTYEEILDDMIAYMQARTSISDYNEGSVIRTILEAAALEDDEQYFQMVQLLDLFSLTTASGEDLDRRLSDFGITRRSPQAATTKGKFVDNNLIRTKIAFDATAGATSLVGFDTTRFPTAGYPYTVRVGEGTSRMQNLVVVDNDTTSMTLTLSTPTVFDVVTGDRLAFVTGGTLANPVAPTAQARVINIGTQVYAPATVVEAARTYTTTEPAYIIAGNYESNEVILKCTTSGKAGNIGARRINQLTSPPFSGAGFYNTTPASGGLDRETDSEFRVRALNQLQSLSRGTPLALKTYSLGVLDPKTQNRVTSSNIVEDFVTDEVFVYVDDGTGAVARTQILATDSLMNAISVGSRTLTPVDATDWPSAGFVLIESDGVNPSELVEYRTKTAGTLTLDAPTAYAHSAGSIINFVDYVAASAEMAQRRYKLTNYPIVRNSERIWMKAPAGNWNLLVPGTDYVLNKGTGEFQLRRPGGVVAGTKLVAHYTYYVGLIKEVQRVLEGDSADAVNFPGVKAAGVFLSVEQPTIKRIAVSASITAADGFVESDIAPDVRRAIEAYISALRIGEDVIVSKIIEAASTVRGVADVRIIAPASNIIVLESELPVPFNASGESLIQVT